MVYKYKKYLVAKINMAEFGEGQNCRMLFHFYNIYVNHEYGLDNFSVLSSFVLLCDLMVSQWDMSSTLIGFGLIQETSFYRWNVHQYLAWNPCLWASLP